MIWNGNDRYCTLFWPKYCALAGRAVTRAATAKAAAAVTCFHVCMLRSILSCPAPVIQRY